MRLWAGALVVLVVTLGSAASAGAVPAGPFGDSQVQIWRVGSPACAIEQSWKKDPGALTVRSIALKAAVSCASVPSFMDILGTLTVYDLTSAPAGPPVLESSAAVDPSSSPASFSMTPVLVAPKLGHHYLFQFDVSFVDNANATAAVSNPPAQCRVLGNSKDPFGTGPPQWVPASMDCVFAEEIAVL
jgi:hypothetical protein